MTNEMIILNERLDAAEQGIIGTTGKMITIETPDGEKVTVAEPEEMHTFQTWKSLGFSVQKGQKAKVTTRLWRYNSKKKKSEDNNEKEDGENSRDYYLCKAFLFSASQVAKI